MGSLFHILQWKKNQSWDQVQSSMNSAVKLRSHLPNGCSTNHGWIYQTVHELLRVANSALESNLQLYEVKLVKNLNAILSWNEVSILNWRSYIYQNFMMHFFKFLLLQFERFCEHLDAIKIKTLLQKAFHSILYNKLKKNPHSLWVKPDTFGLFPRHLKKYLGRDDKLGASYSKTFFPSDILEKFHIFLSKMIDHK